jgi:hypothetical protein
VYLQVDSDVSEKHAIWDMKLETACFSETLALTYKCPGCQNQRPLQQHGQWCLWFAFTNKNAVSSSSNPVVSFTQYILWPKYCTNNLCSYVFRGGVRIYEFVENWAWKV